MVDRESYPTRQLNPVQIALVLADMSNASRNGQLGTSIILVIFGALKSWFTGAALGPVGVAWGAISTLAVGESRVPPLQFLLYHDEYFETHEADPRHVLDSYFSVAAAAAIAWGIVKALET